MSGNWMQTHTGKAFDPVHPVVEDICIEDIAHALSLICRFGGHCRKFYSVAEHCVLMSHAVNPENALAALLHDATEAYVGDMVYPLKMRMPEYRVVEDNLAWAIGERFGVSPVLPNEVKAADLRIVIDERDALMGPPPAPWAALDGLEPLGVHVSAWIPITAEKNYLNRFRELTTPR